MVINMHYSGGGNHIIGQIMVCANAGYTRADRHLHLGSFMLTAKHPSKHPPACVTMTAL